MDYGWEVPRNISELRQFLCSAILRQWHVPMIEPVADSGYEIGEDRASFWIHNYRTSYKVTIEKVERK